MSDLGSNTPKSAPGTSKPNLGGVSVQAKFRQSGIDPVGQSRELFPFDAFSYNQTTRVLKMLPGWTFDGASITVGTITATQMASQNFNFSVAVGNGPADNTWVPGFLRIFMGLDNQDPQDDGFVKFGIKAFVRNTPANYWRNQFQIAQRAANNYTVDSFLTGESRQSKSYSRFGFNQTKSYATGAVAIGANQSFASSASGVTLMVSDASAVLRSTDGGKTWSGPLSLAGGLATLTTGLLWITGTTWVAQVFVSGAFKFTISTDDGSTWSTPVIHGGDAETNIGTTCYSGNSYIVAAHASGIGTTTHSREIRRSTDGGLTWNYVTVFTSGAAANFISSLACDPISGWCVATQFQQQRLAYSHDGGATWVEVNLAMSVVTTDPVYVYGGRFYLFQPASGGSAHLYSDDGINWFTSTSTARFNTFSSFVGTPFGLYIDNGGINYVSYDNGLNFVALTGVATGTGCYDLLHRVIITAETSTNVRIYQFAESGLPGQTTAHWRFTVSGAATWTAPWAGWFKFKGIGAGGGGGGCRAGTTLSIALASAGNGGALAEFYKWCDEGEIIYLTIGAKGTGGAAGLHDGTTGGSSKIGTSVGASDIALIPGGPNGAQASAANSAITITGKASSAAAPTIGSMIATADIIRSVANGNSSRGYAPLNTTPTTTEFVLPSVGGVVADYPQVPISLMSSGNGINGASPGSDRPGSGGNGGAGYSDNTDRSGGDGSDGEIRIDAAA